MKSSRVILPLVVLIATASCASSDYSPVIMDAQESSQSIINSDNETCTKIANAVRRGFDAKDAAGDTIKAGLDNASWAAFDWTVTVVGMAKGFFSYILESIGVLNDNRKSIYFACMKHLGQKHGYTAIGMK